jgi:hypothetical protein
MKNLIIYYSPQSVFNFVTIIILSLSLVACQTEEILSEQEMELQEDQIEQQNEFLKKSNIIQVSSNGMSFNAPTTIQSGWTTFLYENNTRHPHFFVLEKLPEGKTVEDSREEIVPVFQEGMDHFNEYNFEAGFAAFAKLPAWFNEIVFTGGPGIIDSGKTAETTVWLEPGDYVIECYIKTPNGTFHAALGMMEGLHVEETNNGQREPKSSLDVTISSTGGIQFPNKIRPGMHTFAVTFENQIMHDNFLGHDVHLVKLNQNEDIAELNAWMNWADPAQFKTPAPAGIEFLGGTQELPAGKTAYFSAHLKPGTYAFIAEVPDPLSKGMLKIFNVPK